jgi:CheY-like chemotaxis protein
MPYENHEMPYEHLKQMRTMLVDDDPWIRDSMQLLFETEGCPLMTLKSAEEGLDALRQGHCFDLFIVDYRLPGMDGLSFLRQVISMHPKAIRILCTAYANDAVAAGAGSVEIHALVPKPFTTFEFERVLAGLVAHA